MLAGYAEHAWAMPECESDKSPECKVDDFRGVHRTTSIILDWVWLRSYNVMLAAQLEADVEIQ